MNFGSKLFPLECTQAKKLTDGRLGRHGRPHVRRTTDITVSQKLTLSKLRWAKNKVTADLSQVCGMFWWMFIDQNSKYIYLFFGIDFYAFKWLKYNRLLSFFSPVFPILNISELFFLILLPPRPWFRKENPCRQTQDSLCQRFPKCVSIGIPKTIHFPFVPN